MRRGLKILFKAVVIILLGALILAGVFFSTVYYGVFGPLPTSDDLLNIENEEASLVLSSSGKIIGKYFAENRTNIGWNDIPEHLVNALVATEDKRFYLHDGYDGRSYLRVFVKSILLGDRSSGGGSTLTQQLVKNLYGRNYHSFLSMPVNKLKEAIIAVRLENVLTKQQILLLYLNSVPFGEDVYGVEAAALRFFNKHCSELNIQQSAVLVGLLKANTYYNPRLNPENAIKRRNQVLALMKEQGYITSSKYDNIVAEPLGLSYFNYQNDTPAGYFVYQVKKKAESIIDDYNVVNQTNIDIEKDGLRIYTTLDVLLQEIAQNAVVKQLTKMQKLLDRELKNSRIYNSWFKKQTAKYGSSKLNEISGRSIFTYSGIVEKQQSLADSLWYYYSMLNSAVLITDPRSGEVLTWIGGNNYRFLPYDLILSKRQVASTIKPLIYASGLEKKYVPCDYLSNKLIVYKDYGGWAPQNYDGSSSKDTLVALWYALSKSMNLPTMDLYFNTGHDDIVNTLLRFGLEPPLTETPSIALGSMDVSLLEIVKAYTAFANNGKMVDDLVMINKITTSKGELIYQAPKARYRQVIEANIADQITQILETAVNEGTGIALRSRFGISSPLAGKTGTAQNYSDAWFMAYTPKMVLGTWVGANSPEVHFRGGLGSGSALALPIAGTIISTIEQNHTLSKKYMADFTHFYARDEIIHCDPFFEKGLSGIVNRIKSNNKNKDHYSVEDSTTVEKPKKRSKIGKFFDKIFGRKKN